MTASCPHCSYIGELSTFKETTTGDEVINYVSGIMIMLKNPGRFAVDAYKQEKRGPPAQAKKCPQCSNAVMICCYCSAVNIRSVTDIHCISCTKLIATN